MYLTLKVEPYDPPVISPLVGSITAPSLGESTKLKLPPKSPIIVAIAPSQVGVNSNVGSSLTNVVTDNSEIEGHWPVVS